jgi:hypothetical protein
MPIFSSLLSRKKPNTPSFYSRVTLVATWCLRYCESLNSRKVAKAIKCDMMRNQSAAKVVMLRDCRESEYFFTHCRVIAL